MLLVRRYSGAPAVQGERAAVGLEEPRAEAYDGGLPVLIAATRDAARAMGRGSDLGTVEAGKVADLLVLEGDPLADVRSWRRIDRVMRGGRLYERADLEYR